MKTLSRSFLSAIAVVLFFGTAYAGEWSKIRVGVEGAYPPFRRK